MTTQSTLPNPENMMMESGQPIRGFIGKLQSMSFGKPRENSTQTPLLFSHLETKFIDTLTPMQDGIQYVVDIPWSEKGTSRWEAVCLSAKHVMKLGEDGRLPMGELVNQILEWKWASIPGRIQNDEGNWIQGITDGWIIVAIGDKRHPDFPAVVAGGNGIAVAPVAVEEGELASDLIDDVPEEGYAYARALAIGKSKATWLRDALNHRIVKDDTDLWKSIAEVEEAIFNDDSTISYEDDLFAEVSVA